MKSDAAPLEPRYAALLQLLRTAETVWNTSRVFFARWDLSPSQFNVLNLLHDHPDGLSQSELGRQLIMHRSNVTGLVDRLLKRGLVERRDVAADRRAYRVLLTAEGRNVLRQILPKYYQEAVRVWDGITPGRISTLLEDLREVAARAEQAAAQIQKTRSADL
jgi:DNA-binding MarR family transcriptional regulator